jgi:hypothetical protein
MKNHRTVLAVLGVCLLGALRTPTVSADEKLLKKVEKLDARLASACADLAKKFDELKDPEAAHFFASCALGYGPKDDKLLGIKNVWEISVFIGQVRGGKPLADAEPIKSALLGLSQEYRAIRDALWTDGVRGNLGEASTKVLRDSGVKMELTQNAHEYIRATQRFNALRQAMGLRAVFWDYENSTRLILVAWYMAQTGDYNDNLGFSRSGVNKNHVLYTPAVEDAKKQTAVMNGVDITKYPEHLRPMPLHRESLLNPNARTLWLARWIKGYALGTTVLHTIPQLPYRPDIPTPAARFKDETVVKPFSSWVDTEDTILIGEKKTPYVRYPYDGEPDAPFVCYGGEDGWAEAEYQFLDRAGVPIMLRFFVNSIPTKIEASLTDATNKRIAYRLYTNKDKRVPDMDDWATVLLLPNEKLAPRTRYTVAVSCTIKKTEFSKEWSFTTRSE